MLVVVSGSADIPERNAYHVRLEHRFAAAVCGRRSHRAASLGPDRVTELKADGAPAPCGSSTVSKNLELFWRSVRKIAEGSGGNLDVAVRRALMRCSADPSFKDGVLESFFGQLADYILARNPDLSAQEVKDKIFALLEKESEAAITHVLSVNGRSRQERLHAALFDVALDLHPNWEAVGLNGTVRYIGKRRPGKLGAHNLVDWLFKNYPSKAQAIRQYFESSSGDV
jgi:hypothetical protein